MTSFRQAALELLPKGHSFNTCLACGLCSQACPAAGLEGMDPRKFVRMAMLGMDEALSSTPWAWMCTMCRRCTHVCPMHIDIPQLVYLSRKNRPDEEKPAGIVRSCQLALTNEGHSAMGARTEDVKEVVEDILGEVKEEFPQFADMEVPFDRQDAYFFMNQNSREPVHEPEEMAPLWKILHLAGADWTYGSKGWAAENFCIFSGNEEAWRTVLEEKVAYIEKLGCKVWLNTECGHSYYAVKAGLGKFGIPHSFRLESLISWYARWIREGKLPVNAAWNTEGLTFTVQDPCQLVRKTLGDPVAEDLRYVIKKVVGEENFVEMHPNRSFNYCCGGGGGFLQATAYTAERRQYGKRKLNQILATGADYCITPCHNCHSQIHDLAGFYGAPYKTVHLWTLICLSLGILGENERLYL